MPRTLQEILDHADELADMFESEDFGAKSEERDAATLRELSRAVQERAFAEARVAEAVAVARADGQPWSAIGLMLGTSGEAARQKYGKSQVRRRAYSSGVVREDKLVDLMSALAESIQEAKTARTAHEADDPEREAEAVKEDKLVDLMSALAESIQEAKTARTAQPSERSASVDAERQSTTTGSQRRRAG